MIIVPYILMFTVAVFFTSITRPVLTLSLPLTPPHSVAQTDSNYRFRKVFRGHFSFPRMRPIQAAELLSRGSLSAYLTDDEDEFFLLQ